jgi:hypothetical protein
MTDLVRDTTQHERLTWGKCPVCSAEHGEPCDSNVGIPLGRNVNGHAPTTGAHLGRLHAAPMQVRIVPV